MRRLEESTPKLVNFRIAFRIEGDSADRWFVKFAPGDEECGNSTNALVTRTDPNTWVFEAGPGDRACVVRQEKPGSPVELRGYYTMPTQLVMVGQP